MDNNEWYYLDPDNNKPSPEVLHCCRCKRKVKDTQAVTSFFSVELHLDHPLVRKSITGKYLIGADCWNKIIKDGPAKLT